MISKVILGILVCVSSFLFSSGAFASDLGATAIQSRDGAYRGYFGCYSPNSRSGILLIAAVLEPTNASLYGAASWVKPSSFFSINGGGNGVFTFDRLPVHVINPELPASGTETEQLISWMQAPGKIGDTIRLVSNMTFLSKANEVFITQRVVDTSDQTPTIRCSNPNDYQAAIRSISISENLRKYALQTMNFAVNVLISIAIAGAKVGGALWQAVETAIQGFFNHLARQY